MLAFAILSALNRRIRCRSRLPAADGSFAGVLAVVAVVCVCAAGTALRIETTKQGLLPQLSEQGGAAEVSFQVVSEPRPIRTGWQVILRVDEVVGVRTRERSAVVLVGPPPALGTRWHALATARPLPEDGYGRWLARQHVGVIVDLRRLEPAEPPPGLLARGSEAVRERVRRAAARHLDPAAAGLLVGLVTGDTRLLPATDREAMRAAGISHLTAVSGSNVGLVVAGAAAVAAALRLGAGMRRGVVAVAVAWFAFLTRLEPSVMRAATMALVAAAAGVRGVLGDPRHALSAAVLLLVLVDPRLAGSPGLLLSALATLGVLVVAPVVRQRLPDRLPSRLADLLAITLGAQIAVVPLLLATDGTIGLGSLPANLVAVPVAAIASALAVVGSLVAVVHLELGAAVFVPAALPAWLVLGIARRFAERGGLVTLGRPVTVAALCLGVLWLLAPPRRPARLRLGIAAVTALILAVTPALVGGLPPTGFSVTAIDVGQGDAYLVETPDARILVDAGTDLRAVRWLRSNGRRRLDLAVVTHPHQDHVGGMPAVVDRIRVDALWYRPSPDRRADDDPLLLRAARSRTPVHAPSAGDELTMGTTVIRVLHPPRAPQPLEPTEVNDRSLVLVVVHGGRRLLVTGDVESGAQRELVRRDRGRLRADLLLVPHHGAGTTDPAFLAAVDPSVAVISVGRQNPHGHPHPRTLETLRQLGTHVRRTDREGTLRVAVPASTAPSPDRRHRPSRARGPPGSRLQ